MNLHVKTFLIVLGFVAGMSLAMLMLYYYPTTWLVFWGAICIILLYRAIYKMLEFQHGRKKK